MKRLLAVLLVAMTLTGCSAVQLAYNNADIYLRWRATSYLDVHGESADELDGRIQELLAWHRRQALPQYAQLADDAARRLSRGLTREDMDWSYDALMVQAREGLRAAAERFAPMLDRLTPEQQAHFERQLAEDNRRFARDNIRGSDAERRELRARRVEERLEDWVGPLSGAQVERIRRFSAAAPLLGELRDRENKRLQAAMLDMIRARDASQRLPGLAANWRYERDPAFGAADDAWRQEVFALLLDVDRTLTPAQRARAVAQLQRYASDMRLLAARAAP